MGPSIGIERGIEAYMVNVDKSLDNFQGKSYAILDSEVQVSGGFGIVYYTARYDYEGEDGELHTIPLRSVDVYRRESGRWIQAGSHITVIPSEGVWGEGKGDRG
jgi:ketosteroid isomerase-like protein